MKSAHEPWGEVTQSTLDRITAQAWQWNVFPPFGSIIQCSAHQYTLLGVVSGIQTTTADSSHQVRTYKKSLSELQDEQPHIFSFLATHLDIHVIGYQASSSPSFWYGTPPYPAPLHSFITPLPQELPGEIIREPAFLPRLHTQISIPHLFDALICAMLQNSSHQLNKQDIASFCEHYAYAVHNDYHRIKTLCTTLKKNHQPHF